MTADAPIVRGGDRQPRRGVGPRTVVQLPLNGRTFITLAGIAPGVALPPNSLLPRINGGRPRTNEYLFDGISVLQPEPGQVAIYPVVDAIQEFRIESNSPPAEFGRFNGGVVNLTMKSGGERVSRRRLRVPAQRGAERAQFLPVDESGEARLPPQSVRRHARRADRQGPDVLLRRLSGPAPGDRAHGDVNGADAAAASGDLHRSDRRPGAGDLRSGDRRRGADRLCRRRDSAARMDPVALALLQRYPAPTAAGVANNYSRTANEADDQDQWDARIDHKFAAGRDQVFGRLSYFRDGFLPVTPLPDGSGVTSGTLGPQDTTAWAFASNYQHTFSANRAQRAAHRRHAPNGRAHGGAARVERRRRAEHSGHSVDGEVSQHAADVPDRRLPAARLAGQHRVGLQHQRL